MATFNIIDYGARPGEFDSTRAIQRAIDTCGEDGGGMVLIPAGTFSTDMLTLRDNVELHLENGCTLLSLLKPIPEDNVSYAEASFNMKRWLIGGWSIQNASITGKGTIDGRGYINFWNKNDGYEHPLYGQRYWPSLHRPRALLHFRKCTDILIRDVTLLDPPAYNIWLSGCHRCDIDGIRIRTDERGPNNDGIDIDCCSNIRVHGCDIITNDDAIGIFSDINTLGEDKPCENILVSDCRIKAISDGIRIGYVGDGAIRRVTISNCIVYESMIGISMMVAISPGDPRGVYIKNGPRISDVNFDNLVIDAEQAFNFQSPKSPPSCPDPIKGHMDRIFLRNITATAHRGSFFGGVEEAPLGTIEISQLNLTLSGEMGDGFRQRVPEPYPVWTDMPFDGLPWPFFLRHAGDFTLRDSRIRWQDATGNWMPEIVRAEHSAYQLKDVLTQNQPQMPPTQEFPVDFNGRNPCFEAPLQELHCSGALILQGNSMRNGNVGTALRTCLEKSSIKTIVWDHSACRELYECFYRSSRYSDMLFHDGIAPLLKTCRASELYLGTYASTALWRSALSEAALAKEITEQRCCIAELFKLGDFTGFFFPLCRPGLVSYPDDWAHRTKLLYGAFAEKVRELSPQRKVLLPISAANVPGTLEDFVNEWKSILDEAKPDALLVTGNQAEIWRQLEYPIIYA